MKKESGKRESKQYDRQKKTELKKNRPSTFFPTDWTKELLVLKLHQAFQNRKETSDTDSTGERNFMGKTDCGIKVVFRIKENEEIVSVYPEYE